MQKTFTETAAFDWRKRGLAFFAMGLFWVLLVVGLVVNQVTDAG